MSKENLKASKVGQVYMVLLDNGWLKVGVGSEAGPRIAAASIRIPGATAVLTVASSPLYQPRSAERELIAMCDSLCRKKHGREWFYGVPHHEVQRKIADIERKDKPQKASCTEPTANPDEQATFDSIFYGFAKWSRSLEKAYILEGMLKNLGCADNLADSGAKYGWIFDGDSEEGCSFFFISAALVLYSMTIDEQADLFAHAAFDCGSCLERIIDGAHELVVAP